jgi:hypothetical protein
MDVEYRFCDDSRHKEGDLAREGLVHLISVEGNQEECKEIFAWVRDNILPKNVRSISGGTSSFTSPTVYWNHFYMRNSEDVFLLRLTFP